jgi:hypothetical protein
MANKFITRSPSSGDNIGKYTTPHLCIKKNYNSPPILKVIQNRSIHYSQWYGHQQFVEKPLQC